MTKKKRVFSGSRPTGRLHLGNYLGGVKGYLALQERGDLDCIYSVVDLHGMTTPYNPKTLQRDIHEVVLDYLGAGLDPKKCHLMIQSQVPEHVELAYLFSTIYPVSRLEQLPTYKDKKIQFPKYVNIGLLYYPILMAADILIYKAELVPVGIDQEPHLEVAREIARKFNRMFPSTSPSATSPSTVSSGLSNRSGPSGSGRAIFPEPQRFATKGESVPSLIGKGKMSKTVKDSYILLTDDLKTIEERLAKAPTDIGHGKTIPKEGGVANLLILAELFMGKKARQEYEKQYLGKGLPAAQTQHEPCSDRTEKANAKFRRGIKYADLKEKLARAIYKELVPIQERRKYFEEHPKEVDKILEEGRKYCSQIAKKTLLEAKKAMGLVTGK